MMEDPKIYRTLGPIYVSSVQPLVDHVDLQKDLKIKTIVSIMKEPKIPTEYTDNSKYNYLNIPIDDLSTEIIIPHIPKVNELILKTIYEPIKFEDTLLEKPKMKLSGDAVLIHCQSGVSRSVSFIIAYLMNRHNLDFDLALHAIQRNNKEKEFKPNEGFIEQLKIYKNSEFITDLNLLKKKSAQWRAYRMEYLVNKSTSSNNEFSDVNIDKTDSQWFGFKCSKCRCLLASSESYLPHSPPYDENDKQLYFTKTVYKRKRVIDRQKGAIECTHIFTEPLNWMKDTVTNHENDEILEGRLDCHKCNAKVGGYNWKGSRCSCGKWMVPAIHLLKSKIVQIDNTGKLILPSDDRYV